MIPLSFIYRKRNEVSEGAFRKLLTGHSSCISSVSLYFPPGSKVTVAPLNWTSVKTCQRSVCLFTIIDEAPSGK